MDTDGKTGESNKDSARVCSDFAEETGSCCEGKIVEVNSSVKHADLAALTPKQKRILDPNKDSARVFSDFVDVNGTVDYDGLLEEFGPLVEDWEPLIPKRKPILLPKEKRILDPKQKQVLDYMFMHCAYDYLARPFRTWEEKVAMILHWVRKREFTDFDPKKCCRLPYRFSLYNIAFFDFDKESEVVHGPKFRDILPYKYDDLELSFNVISIKVAESDVSYPVEIYGTILVRDHNNYRCVYLFKRGRDDPQLITRKNRMLALTGPYRALGGNGSMFFEFDLKMKGEGAVDEDFSKGLKVLDVFRHTPGKPWTFSLESYLSTLEMVCVPVRYVLEASIGVNFLNGKSTFTGNILASTSGSCTSNKMVMYDSQVAGTKTEFGSDGFVYLSRHIIAVPRGEDLLLYFVARDSCNKSRHLKFVISQGVDERTRNLGTYKLRVQIVWKGVFRQHRVHLHNIGDTAVLW